MTEFTTLSGEDGLRVIRHIASTNQVSLPWDELRQVLEARLANILDSKVLTEVIPARVPATIVTVSYEPTDPSSSPLSSPTFSFDDPSAGTDDLEAEQLQHQHVLTQMQGDLEEEGAAQQDADLDEDKKDDKEDEDRKEKKEEEQTEQREYDQEDSVAQQQQEQEASTASVDKKEKEEHTESPTSSSASTQEQQQQDSAASTTDTEKHNVVEESKDETNQHENSSTTPAPILAPEALTVQQDEPKGDVVDPTPTVESQPLLASRDLPAYETPDAYHKRINALLRTFSSAPFTIQRICELMLDPTAHHTLVTKYLRAVEKVLNITSSVDEFSNPAYIGQSALDAKDSGEPVGVTAVNGDYGTRDSKQEGLSAGFETSMPGISTPVPVATTESPEESRTVPSLAQDCNMDTSVEGGLNTNAVPAASLGEDMAMDVDPPVATDASNSNEADSTITMEVDP